MTAALGSGSAPRPLVPQPWARALPLLLGSGPIPFEATRQPSSGRPKSEDLRPKPLTGTPRLPRRRVARDLCGHQHQLGRRADQPAEVLRAARHQRRRRGLPAQRLSALPPTSAPPTPRPRGAYSTPTPPSLPPPLADAYRTLDLYGMSHVSEALCVSQREDVTGHRLPAPLALPLAAGSRTAHRSRILRAITNRVR